MITHYRRSQNSLGNAIFPRELATTISINGHLSQFCQRMAEPGTPVNKKINEKPTTKQANFKNRETCNHSSQYTKDHSSEIKNFKIKKFKIGT